MKTNRTAMTMPFVAGLTLCAALVPACTAQAQGPGNRRPPTMMPTRANSTVNSAFGSGQTTNSLTANGQTLNGMAGGAVANGNRGNTGSQTPLALGTVLDGNASTGQILIQSALNGSRQIVQISNATRLVTLTPITTGDLQIGEQVQIQGTAVQGTAANAATPTITSASITAGQMPEFVLASRTPALNPNSGSSASMGTTASRSANTARNASATSAQATMTIIGQVTATAPLTVTLNNGIAVTVTPAAQAQVSRVTPLLFRNLQVGDQLMATGQVVSNNTLAATSVAINM